MSLDVEGKAVRSAVLHRFKRREDGVAPAQSLRFLVSFGVCSVAAPRPPFQEPRRLAELEALGTSLFCSGRFSGRGAPELTFSWRL